MGWSKTTSMSSSEFTMIALPKSMASGDRWFAR
jgi:hypothetical protein